MGRARSEVFRKKRGRPARNALLNGLASALWREILSSCSDSYLQVMPIVVGVVRGCVTQRALSLPVKRTSPRSSFGVTLVLSSLP
jgi:hypothetical protein